MLAAAPTVPRQLRRDGEAVSLFGQAIPAGEGPGPTRAESGTCPLSGNHPRTCGADLILLATRAVFTGPAPRIQGRGMIERRDCVVVRTIPVCAGPMTGALPCSADGSGHPRRVRGGPGLDRLYQVVRRNIPAGAGPTWALVSAVMPTSDHPRRCGANTIEPSGPAFLIGPSPRVRGNTAQFRHDPRTPGPSPRVRRQLPLPDAVQRRPGTILAGAGPTRHRRTIPAGAGPTACRLGERSSPTDHPRGCGANPVSIASTNSLVGPSPRVRGHPAPTARPPYITGPSPRVRGQP